MFSRNIDFTVYSTGPKNLSNIARHDVDIRLVPSGALDTLIIDTETDYIINFSHPFGTRDELNAREQITAFVRFVGKQKEKIPGLKLIHTSSMSVYEPFAQHREFEESHPISPPVNDLYAADKAYAEKEFKKLPEYEKWQFHLRPTIVYGPFGRPWTDRVFLECNQGDVPYVDLSGRIQPVYVGDITRLINILIDVFRPGTFNFAGDEIVDWYSYLDYYQKIANKGRLLKDKNASSGQHEATSVMTFYKQNMKALIYNIVKDPAFDRMAVPIAKRIPRRVVLSIRSMLIGTKEEKKPEPPLISFFASNFFKEDRLVSMHKFRQEFNSLNFTSMETAMPIITDYYEYRFTDKIYH